MTMREHRKNVLSKNDIPALCKELIPSLVERSGRRQALGLCPFHPDKRPSLSVKLETGAFFCHSCDKKGAGVIDLLKDVRGLSFNEAMRELERRAGLPQKYGKVKRRETGKYEYFDADGVLLHWKVRVEPGRDGRSKEFIFYHTGERGGRRSGKNCTVLYNLPRVIQGSSVIIVEGEKQADLLTAWGLTATTLDCGAKSNLTQEMIEQLSRKSIVILPDNDDPGREYAERIAIALESKATSVKVVSLPGLPEKGDIVDWDRDPGNDKTELLKIITVAPEWQPTAVKQHPQEQMISTGQATSLSNIENNESPSPTLRSFPRIYLDSEKLLNNPLRYHFKLGQEPVFDSICFRLCNAPGARLPNVPDAIARQIGSDEGTVQNSISVAIQHGFLVLDDDGNLSNPVITEAHVKATETCIRNSEYGQKGGLSKARKARKRKGL